VKRCGRGEAEDMDAVLMAAFLEFGVESADRQRIM
jgi:hypothetical protein